MRYQYSRGEAHWASLFSQLLGFCGPGCCGGNYSVDLSVFFDNGGGLFGISRVGADMTIPVMSNLDVKVKFATPNSLDVGWTFKFRSSSKLNPKRGKGISLAPLFSVVAGLQPLDGGQPDDL